MKLSKFFCVFAAIAASNIAMANEPIIPLDKVHYVVKKGDSLSSIFDKHKIRQQTLSDVLEADMDALALDLIMPGDELSLYRHPSSYQLERVELSLDPSERYVFTRQKDDSFSYDKIEIPGEWVEKPLGGVITRNFYLTAKKAGLASQEIKTIELLFSSRINFSRDFHKNDTFEVVRSEQYVDGERTGNTKITAIRFKNKGEDVAAYLYDDGLYYDENGNSLQTAFNRYPVNSRYRISSSFNPKRRHPVTGRVQPHNGTDFAAPRGTPVFSTGDGIVKTVAYHRFAGNYGAIAFGNKYRARYLHMDKAYVKKGQRVKRGQKIGSVGRTGRVTGTHLHYEFHINGRAVNPMKADIPVVGHIALEDEAVYQEMMRKKEAMMDRIASLRR